MYLHMCFKSLDLLQTSFQFYNVTWTKTIKHIHTINKTFTNAFFNNSSRILTSILITRSLKLHETPIAYLDCCCNQIFWWNKIYCKWKSRNLARWRVYEQIHLYWFLQKNDTMIFFVDVISWESCVVNIFSTRGLPIFYASRCKS